MKSKGFVKRKVVRSGSGKNFRQMAGSYVVRTLEEKERQDTEIRQKFINTRGLESVTKPAYKKFGEPSPRLTIGEDGIARQK